jgi:ribonuclease HI
MVKIYTDSSYDDKKRIAGIGCVIIRGSERHIFSNNFKASTNNEGELFAIWFALNLCPNEKVTLYTDSLSAINLIENPNPKDKTLTPEQRENRARCRYWAYKIRQQIKNLDSFEVEHIKAHTGKFQQHYINNQLADLLAREGRAKFYEQEKALLMHKNCIKSK